MPISTAEAERIVSVLSKIKAAKSHLKEAEEKLAALNTHCKSKPYWEVDLNLKKDAKNPHAGSRNACGWRDRRWPHDQLCEPAKVLCDCGQRKLELRTARPAQSQAAEPQDAL